MGWDYAFELWPPTGLVIILQITHEYGEQWQKDTERRKPKNLEKNLSQCHYAHHKSHME
jgi:hypothetical protein